MKSRVRNSQAHFSWLNSNSSEGFTIIEILVVIFVIGTVISGLFGLFLLTLRTSQGNERRIVAVALANERMEMVRNLPYVHVGTAGGIPSGSLLQEETIERNGVPYTVKVNIGYIDDPFDGTGEEDPINIDYKQVRIEVTWPHPTKTTPVLLITTVAPPGVEGGDLAGTLALQVLNAAGLGVPDVIVKLSNSTVDPPVNFQTQTNSEGKFIIPGLKESVTGYRLEVSKAGYNTKKTYDVTENFFPDADHSHLTALPGVLTEKTFSIDLLSGMTIRFVDEEGEVLPNVAYRLRGSKTIGLDAEENVVYSFDNSSTADELGVANISDLEWDNYHLLFDGLSPEYDIKLTDPMLPVSLNAGEERELIVTLVPHTPISMHLTVASLGEPVPDATVSISRGEITASLVTGPLGQVLFPDLLEEGEYEVTISAVGYVPATALIKVEGTQREIIELIPN